MVTKTWLSGTALLAVFLIGCELVPTANRREAQVDELRVFTALDDRGTPGVFAEVRGRAPRTSRLEASSRQRVNGYRIYAPLYESMTNSYQQTPMAEPPVPYTTRIPIDVAGLAPGVYIINVNGREEHLELKADFLRRVNPPVQDNRYRPLGGNAPYDYRQPPVGPSRNSFPPQARDYRY